ncbi:hypothetical protein G3M48_000218 [Beauveria asiatica]|uniref:Uncharacterized protein n=1 Tax=Beauveria asiatica TaxID=1069075 RepID=A0AAW0S0M9_9HYPO
MTDASILDCLCIDPCAGGLYNLFGGPNENRVVAVLQILCDEVLEASCNARFEPWWAEPEIFSAYLADGDAGDFADAPPPAYPRGLHMPSDRHGNNKTGIGDMKIFPTQAEMFSNVAEFLPSTDPEQPHFPTDKSQPRSSRSGATASTASTRSTTSSEGDDASQEESGDDEAT